MTRTTSPPPLTWSGVPDEAEELVLLCEDPDAPSGTFVHWLVTGIDPAPGAWRPVRRRGAAGRTATASGSAAGAARSPRPATTRTGTSSGSTPLRSRSRSPDRVTADDAHAVLDRRQLASGTLVGLYRRWPPARGAPQGSTRATSRATSSSPPGGRSVSRTRSQVSPRPWPAVAVRASRRVPRRASIGSQRVSTRPSV